MRVARLVARMGVSRPIYQLRISSIMMIVDIFLNSMLLYYIIENYSQAK